MRLTSALACLIGLSSLPAQEPISISYSDLLRRMTDFDWLWHPPRSGERCVQFSSYDRRSDEGRDDAEAWYANEDRGHYLRVEQHDGRKEYVMVDVDGPGVVSRIWSANPSGELFFDVDGRRVWSVDFADLTSGAIDPIVEPLAGVRARGANCYLPIPFAEHLVLSSDSGDCYYQVNVARFPAGTKIPSFSPERLREHADEIRATAARLADLGVAPGAIETSGGPRLRIPAGRLVTEVLVDIEPTGDAFDLGEEMRRVLLVVACGEEETVRVPIGDFFCAGSEWAPWRGATLSIERIGANGRRARCTWPMPMPDGGRIELVVPGEDDSPRLGLTARTRRLSEGIAPLLFRASYHQEKAFASRPFRDFEILKARGGPGRFVGCSLLVKNPTRAWWGEGDEKFYVDGETFPSTFGTGTEDYFGYAWCCPQPFASAFHAQTQCDGPGNYGFTALHRSQVLDSVPFRRSFTFDLEVWHWVAGLKMDYASVAYWYGAPGARSGLPEVPPARRRRLDRLPPPPVFVADGAIEGESLKVLEVTGGTHQVQDMAFLEETFSRDGQRWWRDGKPGDVLVLAVPIAEDGTYRVTGAFCKADDYGRVRLELQGHALGEPFDGYAPRVASSGPIVLGTVPLRAGEARLRVEIVGRNPDAIPKHMFGLDYLRLERVR